MKILQAPEPYRTATVLAMVLLVMVSSCSRQPHYPAPDRAGQDVVIDVASLKPDYPVFYTFLYRDVPISFFVLKLNDEVLSFLDACASCYPHKQGYRYDGGSVTCRFCNLKFPVYKLGKGLGGCYPIRIEGRLENGKYLIPVAALEGAADKF